jgi:hypothetical protein
MEQITKEWLESIFTEVHYVACNNRLVWLHLLDEEFENHWKNSHNAIAYVGVDPEGNLNISKCHEYPTMSLEIICKNKRYHLTKKKAL